MEIKEKNIFKVDQFDNKYDWSKYRFTVDYKEDLTLVRKVSKLLSNQKKFGHIEDIVNILKKTKIFLKLILNTILVLDGKLIKENLIIPKHRLI